LKDRSRQSAGMMLIMLLCNLKGLLPALEDGLKPVQRRISQHVEMEDGRYNIGGQVYGNHEISPAWDAAIGDALLTGQKNAH